MVAMKANYTRKASNVQWMNQVSKVADGKYNCLVQGFIHVKRSCLEWTIKFGELLNSVSDKQRLLRLLLLFWAEKKVFLKFTGWLTDLPVLSLSSLGTQWSQSWVMKRPDIGLKLSEWVIWFFFDFLYLCLSTSSAIDILLIRLTFGWLIYASASRASHWWICFLTPFFPPSIGWIESRTFLPTLRLFRSTCSSIIPVELQRQIYILSPLLNIPRPPATRRSKHETGILLLPHNRHLGFKLKLDIKSVQAIELSIIILSIASSVEPLFFIKQ